MAETGQCPHCGQPLGGAALPGLCPKCMLQAGAPTEEVGPAGTRIVRPPCPPPAPSEIGRFFPQLEILECLGRGGMGVVYRARQPQLNRIVALKILAPEREAELAFAERFTREAQALARLNHPNIVTVHDFGKVENLYYLLMEHVDGASLRTLLRGGRITPQQALAIVPKICEALQYAHDQGVVHRDIKPENVLLDRQGRVKIADFGIAKIMGAEQPSQTADNQIVGTPHYMAPEQVETPATVDHRADIYSLGVVFYEMLTGELPIGKFTVPSQRVNVDVRLDEVVLRALEKEPERRYQHASEIKTDVEAVTAPHASQTLTAPRPTPATRPLYANLALTLFLAGTLGTLGLMAVSHRHELALIFGVTALVLAVVFGCISWKRRLGRNVVFACAGILAVFGVIVLFLSEVLPLSARTGKAMEARSRAEALEAKARLAATAAAAKMPPPVVIKTVPESGAAGVDPELTQLEVTFSQPMSTESWSWCKTDNSTFPQLVGEPHYVDARTCVLPVKLQPGNVYSLWLNAEKFDGFRNRQQQPAVPYLLVFETRK